MEDSFKFLWPFKKSWTITLLSYVKSLKNLHVNLFQCQNRFEMIQKESSYTIDLSYSPLKICGKVCIYHHFFLCCNWKLIKNVCLFPIPSLGLPKTTVHTRGEIISEVEFLYCYAHKFSVDNFNMEKIRILKTILF